MDDRERLALAKLRLDWAPSSESVWRPADAHVPGLNDAALQAVLAAFDDAEASEGASPLGVAIVGQQGAGKTHLLGKVRDEVQHRGGCFFLVSLLHGRNFWENVVHAVRTGLYQPGFGGEPQLITVLQRLADRLGLDGETSRQITGRAPLTVAALDTATAALRRLDVRWHECRHTLRAMVLLAAQDPAAMDVGEAYLMSASESVQGERAAWRIHPDPRPAHQVLGEMSRLVALTGPSVLAVDQIDTLIAQSALATDDQLSTPVELPRKQLVAEVGDGLMELHETMFRTVTVVACQAQVWESIRHDAAVAVADRFRRATRLQRIPSAAVGRALVETRFRMRFAEAGFQPPYPTWPVEPQAFSESVRFTPRQLFERIDAHVQACLDADDVVPLSALEGQAVPAPITSRPVPESTLTALDDRFAELVGQAELGSALAKETEDLFMPALLEAGLDAYMKEQGDRRHRYSLDPSPGMNPALHARLRYALEKPEDQVHWSFRAIAGSSHRAAQNRIERLRINAGLDPDVPKRKAFLLRTGDWPMGTKKTGELLTQFRAAGGVVIDEILEEDLRTFSALAQLRRKAPAEFTEWLQLRKPAGSTKLFREVFGDSGGESAPGPDSGPPASAVARAAWPEVDPDAAQDGPEVPVGTWMETGAVARFSLASLRKHAVIFAGSGSGKTVLIRRLAEECALLGVSAIVLDPNNDLARLGDAWPRPPGGWNEGDPAKAADYLAHTDVVIWTPRREAGRPLSFQPLPDLASLQSDPDEFALALDTAVAALAPRARMDGSTTKADLAKAVLKEALIEFARSGGTGLADFLALLADLPEDVTTLAKGRAMAEDMSQTLRAAMINDPLFGGAGAALDPGILLTPPLGKRARISVVSLIGLPSDQQRQSFVNQLQMALFAWIKQNPARDRPLGGLFVMDEAQTLAPSGGFTACTASTLALASQARKYGLGLVFATQAPKGIHNRIVGNAATQFYGFINSPTQVAAAKEIAAAKGSQVLDISRLSAGQFYAVSEGASFRKIRVPMCLSHHPQSALTQEEVLVRACRQG